jgi:histone-lysine N-methyltransferase SETMAR
MELTREHFRAMIFYDYKSGLNQSDSFDRLHNAFGDEAPSRATVFNWFAEFKRGRQNLEDEERVGRPATAVTSAHIEAVRELVEADPRATKRFMQHELQIGSAALLEILHLHLGLRKLVSRWVPHDLTLDQKRARVNWCKETEERFARGQSKRLYDILTGDETWVYQYDPLRKSQSAEWVFRNEPGPTKVHRARSVGKQMVASFFSLTGHIATIPVETQRTVTANWYTTSCLPLVFAEVCKRRPKTRLRGILLHHDNASSHTASKTTQFLKDSGVKSLNHPPYSPDLAPCDFFLFPITKDKLRGQRFQSCEDAVDAFINVLNDISKEEWKNCFQQWFQRMRRCIEADGEYFEKI